MEKITNMAASCIKNIDSFFFFGIITKREGKPLRTERQNVDFSAVLRTVLNQKI